MRPYEYDSILDNINLLEKLKEGLKGRLTKKEVKVYTKALDDQITRSKNTIKIKSGSEGIKPSLLNNYKTDIQDAETNFHKNNIR